VPGKSHGVDRASDNLGDTLFSDYGSKLQVAYNRWRGAVGWRQTAKFHKLMAFCLVERCGYQHQLRGRSVAVI
jgi:hypothetical protein